MSVIWSVTMTTMMTCTLIWGVGGVRRVGVVIRRVMIGRMAGVLGRIMGGVGIIVVGRVMGGGRRKGSPSCS